MFSERREPTPLPEPYLIASNEDAALLIGVDRHEMARPEFLKLAAGNARFSNVEPCAAAYGGHQFGQWAGPLGDGRAITLGEVTSPSGDSWEWQIKGAGLTAYSRFGDGRAVLRSTIREYLCSEAMAALGIPTTRALAIAGSSEPVFRERPETAAVLTRLAPSHVRFGTFEFFHYAGENDAVRTLADYVIDRFFADLAGRSGIDRYSAFLQEVVERTARLIAQWQAVGFAHGVMNTDNMSILGLTLDYGPFGFLDAYDAGFICNHTDSGGRYAFDRQPAVGLWNCHALAAALSSIVTEDAADVAVAAYLRTFRGAYLDGMQVKFGLYDRRAEDAMLFADLLTALQKGRGDHTIFFRSLATITKTRSVADDHLAQLFPNRVEWFDWLRRYRDRIALDPRNDDERATAMRLANPKIVLRNYLAQNAILAAENGDFSEIARLHQALRTPFADRPETEAYAAAPPAWAEELSVSCSS